ncbi:MAG: DUF1491 family protein [Pseudomonadota bacterium]
MFADDPETALPRLRSYFWTTAYLRRVSEAGAFGSVSRRGDPSAGTVFIEVFHDEGVDLWAPAAGALGRRFDRVLAGAASFEVSERMEREVAFDTDLWLLTVEDRAGRVFLTADEVG